VGQRVADEGEAAQDDERAHDRAAIETSTPASRARSMNSLARKGSSRGPSGVAQRSAVAIAVAICPMNDA
jgi:hypothetical protein